MATKRNSPWMTPSARYGLVFSIMPRLNSYKSVYDQRKYSVRSGSEAKMIAKGVVQTWDLDYTIAFGLPEVDDRYHIWHVPLLSDAFGPGVGEIVIDANTGQIDGKRSTNVNTVRLRLDSLIEVGGLTDQPAVSRRNQNLKSPIVKPVDMRNIIIQGRSESTLSELPAQSIQLMFTSPPYFNARPSYADYCDYDDYLSEIRKVIRQVYRLLEDGRFAVINSSPVLLRRTKRSESSRRIAVPFDIHRIVIEEGFDFIDDIIWEKPEGAGWATGRGRRFAADRNPLQYKTVPITEYVLVYRKRSSRLIDWHIRNHHDPQDVKDSRIEDGYFRTNIWKIKPAHSKLHPAIFPVELAKKIIQYYSFKNDVVLDPYAGIGTVGEVASLLGRKFVLSELQEDYINIIRAKSIGWLGREAEDIQCINCAPISPVNSLF